MNVFTVQAMEGTCVRAACNGKEAERLYRSMVGLGHGRVRARENQKCTQLLDIYSHTVVKQLGNKFFLNWSWFPGYYFSALI